MINLFLVRQHPGRETVVSDANGHRGYVGKMYLNGMAFDTIERAEGYVRLPCGAYQLQMYRSAKRGNILRPLTTGGQELAGKKNRIRIHAGSLPGHVEGCIAPGFRSPKKNGLPLQGSRNAMTTILLACGPWADRKVVGTFFVLLDHAPPTRAHSLHLLEQPSLSLHSMLQGL